MKQSDLLQLMSEFDQSGLSRIKIKTSDYALTLEKPTAQQIVTQQQLAAPQQVIAMQPSVTATPAAEAVAVLPQSNAIKVNAPLVGTYYSASSPDAPAFVNEGDKVKKGQILCLIEAMKMMNELACPCDGVLIKCHAENGELVSFGQMIFEVEPC